MIVRLDPRSSRRLTVAEVSDLKRLSLEVAATDLAQLEAALVDERAGARDAEDEGHAWIAVDWLRQQVEDADPALLGDFAAMIAFASSRGWTDPTGSRVRVHLTTGPGTD